MLAFLMACSAPPADSGVAPGPLRIMPLGDSLTSGYRVPGGYRLPLSEGLAADGLAFDFVGSLSGPSSMADPEHEGWNTFWIDELLPVATKQVPAHDPDLILLLIGTNDIANTADLENAPQRLDRLLDVLGERPTLVGTLPPVGPDKGNLNIQAYNAGITAVVDARVADGEPLWMVDHNAAMTSEMLLDALHPDEAGYAVMAAQWRAGIHAAGW